MLDSERLDAGWLMCVEKKKKTESPTPSRTCDLFVLFFILFASFGLKRQFWRRKGGHSDI